MESLRETVFLEKREQKIENRGKKKEVGLLSWIKPDRFTPQPHCSITKKRGK
jgi:hypothetical protein